MSTSKDAEFADDDPDFRDMRSSQDEEVVQLRARFFSKYQIHGGGCLYEFLSTAQERARANEIETQADMALSSSPQSLSDPEMADLLLIRARVRFDLRRYEDSCRDATASIERFTRALETAPESEKDYLKHKLAVALHSRAYSQLVLKRMKEAREDSEECIRQDPQFAKPYNTVAHILLEEHTNYDLAVEMCQKALQLCPTLSFAQHNLAQAYRQKGMLELAVQHFDKVLEIDPDDLYVRRKRGPVLRNLMRYDEALADYLMSIRIDPEDDFDGHTEVANIYHYCKHNLDEALRHYSFVLKMQPQTEVYAARGDLFKSLQNFEKAEADYNRALEMDPNFAEGFNQRGILNYDQYKFQEAARDFQRASELSPDIPTYHYNIGNALYELGRLDEAFECQTRAAKLNPKYAAAYNRRGLILYKQGKFQEALVDFNQAIENNPSMALYFYNRANTYRNNKQYDKALADYETAISLDPKDADIFNCRGNMYFSQQLFEKAIEEYNKAVELNSDNGLFFYNRGNAYTYLDDWDSALRDYTSGIATGLKDPSIFSSRANIYYSNDNFEAAAEDYAQALELTPGNEEKIVLYMCLGNAHRAQKNLPEAIAAYTTLLELNPTHSVALASRGNCHYDQEHYSQAEEDYSKAIELSPETAQFYFLRGNARYHLSRHTDAIADYELAMHFRLSDKSELAMLHNYCGIITYEQEDYQEAERSFSRAIQCAPDCATYFYNRGNARANQGKHAKSVFDYDRAMDLATSYVSRIGRGVFEELFQKLESEFK